MSHDVERLLRSVRLRRPSASLDRRVLRELRRGGAQRWTAWMATASAVAATFAVVLATAAFMQSGQQPPSQAELADERAAPGYEADPHEVRHERMDTGREEDLRERGPGGDAFVPRDGHPLSSPPTSPVSEPVNGSPSINGATPVNGMAPVNGARWDQPGPPGELDRRGLEPFPAQRPAPPLPKPEQQ